MSIYPSYPCSSLQRTIVTDKSQRTLLVISQKASSFHFNMAQQSVSELEDGSFRSGVNPLQIMAHLHARALGGESHKPRSSSSKTTGLSKQVRTIIEQSGTRTLWEEAPRAPLCLKEAVQESIFFLPSLAQQKGWRRQSSKILVLKLWSYRMRLFAGKTATANIKAT